MPPTSPHPPGRLRLAAGFLLIAVGIGALWYGAVENYRAAILGERARELQAIAESRVDFIRLWLDERRGDAEVQAGRLMMAGTLTLPPGAPARYSHEQLLVQLEAIRRGHGYKAVVLADREGSVHAGTGTLSAFGSQTARRAAREAIASGRTHIGRSDHAEPEGRHHLDIDIAAPVRDPRRAGAPVVGALVFHLDSRRHLDPLLGRWPALSRSGETFLFEPVGERIVYLTTLQQADHATLDRRLDEVSLAAARAARGARGVIEATDYRGEPVLAALAEVPGLPWFVVAKVDREEALETVRRDARWSGVLSFVLVLALWLALYAWQRHTRSEVDLARRTAREEALAASEARFRKLHEHATDISLLFDRDMIVRFATPAAEGYIGRAAEGEPISTGTARVHPDDVARVEAARKAALDQPGVPQRVRHRLLHGQDGWRVMDATFTNLYADPDVGGLSYQAQDITRREAAEQARSESEERYRLLFDLSPDAVFVHRDGVILFANAAAARLYGAGSATALTGRHWRELADPRCRPNIEARIAALLKGEVSFLAPAEMEYRTLGGQPLLLESTAAQIVVDGQPAIMSVQRDVTERRHAEQQRIDEVRRQRDTLVREVHHRIKNHLQGLAGLLRQQLAPHRDLAPVIEESIAQINAIAVVHGLQGRGRDERIGLRGLVADIAAFLRGITGTGIEWAQRPGQCFGATACLPRNACRWTVRGEEAVPLALVLNELFTNALRHGAPQRAPVLDLQCDATGACLTLVNAGRLPEGFDFAAGRGLGTGLGLVRGLLASAGTRLALASLASGEVKATIWLEPPVLDGPQPDQETSRR